MSAFLLLGFLSHETFCFLAALFSYATVLQFCILLLMDTWVVSVGGVSVKSGPHAAQDGCLSAGNADVSQDT